MRNVPSALLERSPLSSSLRYTKCSGLFENRIALSASDRTNLHWTYKNACASMRVVLASIGVARSLIYCKTDIVVSGMPERRSHIIYTLKYFFTFSLFRRGDFSLSFFTTRQKRFVESPPISMRNTNFYVSPRTRSVLASAYAPTGAMTTASDVNIDVYRQEEKKNSLFIF